MLAMPQRHSHLSQHASAAGRHAAAGTTATAVAPSLTPTTADGGGSLSGGGSRRRRTLALRPDYLKIKKEELRRELRLRGLRISNKRIEMIRKLEKWEQERLEQLNYHRQQQQLLLHYSLNLNSSGDSSSFVQSGSVTLESSVSALASFSKAPAGFGGGSAGGCGTHQSEAVSSKALPVLPPYGFCSSRMDAQKALRRQSTQRQRSVISSENRKRNISIDASGDHLPESRTQRAALHAECQSIVLWRRPLTTLHFFVLEVITLFGQLLAKLFRYKGRVTLALMSVILVGITYHVDASHQQVLRPLERNVLWCAYWLGLGVLSSVGLGTGLHTFLLYLGPHIAAVTLAASTCHSLDFPDPPYPDEIICPEKEGSDTPSIWAIMAKVRVEAFMWGAGTALGELPPYFMARAARQSGQDTEDSSEELSGILGEMRSLEAADVAQLSTVDRAKLAVEKLIEKVGFWGILACASIPNPLFDVAGIMCGHFLVPFRTFFGATLLGKAVIKMHVQKLFVIFACEGSHVEVLLELVKRIPFAGRSIAYIFDEYLRKQRAKLHRGSRDGPVETASLLSTIFDMLVLVMVAYFVISIINSMAQNYRKRISRTIPKSNSNSICRPTSPNHNKKGH